MFLLGLNVFLFSPFGLKILLWPKHFPFGLNIFLFGQTIILFDKKQSFWLKTLPFGLNIFLWGLKLLLEGDDNDNDNDNHGFVSQDPLWEAISFL